MNFDQLSPEDKQLAVTLLEVYREGTKQQIKALNDTLAGYAGVQLNEPDLLKMWDTIQDSIGDGDKAYMARGMVDTQTREAITRAFANHMTGMNWPMYGTDEAKKKQFGDRMQSALAKMGYQWTWD